MTSVLNKDKGFLQCFWDLALPDASARISAAARLITFVSEHLEEERDYALKRLVKGLASSRDSARHGFSTCLCQFLQLPGVTVASVLETLDTTTKVTGSLKGAEERDFLFSKLFCIMSILRSGKTTSNKQEHTNLFDRLLELHQQKGWMREVVVEALLLYCSTLTDAEMISAALAKLKPLVDTPVSEMAAWQLCLCIGLAQLQSSGKGKVPSMWQAAWRKELGETELGQNPVSTQSLTVLKDTLLAATAGFPKIHRVWEYLVSFVVPMDSNRELIPARASSLSAIQEASLQQLVHFLDAHLLPASHEKRGVALHVTTLLVQRVPAECLPIALSAATVNCLRAARGNKAHTLHTLAGHVLDSIVQAAGADVRCKLALVSTFTQFGGANFDTFTNTQTVSTLLSGLGYEAVVAHVHLLVGVVASFQTAGSGEKARDAGNKKKVIADADNDSGDDGDSSESEEGSTAESAQVAEAVAALDALVSLVRNAKIAHRGLVSVTVCAALARLSVFSTGTATLNSVEAPKSEKKAGKKRKGSAGDLGESASATDLVTPAGYYAALEAAVSARGDLPLPAAAAEAVRILDAALGQTPAPAALATAAGTRLLSLLADLGASTLRRLDTPPTSTTDDAAEAADNPSSDNSPTLLRCAWQALWRMHSSGLTIRVVEADEEGTWEDLPGLLKTVHVLQGQEAVAVVEGEGSEGRAVTLAGRLTEAFHGLLLQTIYHALVTGAIDAQALEGLAATVPVLFNPSAYADAEGDDKSDAGSNASGEEGDALSRAMMHLFEVSLELLSLSAEQHQATRGLRDAVKKAWQAVCALHGASLSVDVIDGIVAAVIGEEHRADSAEDGAEDGEDGESDGEEMDVDEPTPSAASAKKPAQSAATKPGKSSKGTAKQAQLEEEEEEDVLISDEAAFDMLIEGAEDDEDAPSGVLEHSEEVDDALAQMIALKQQSRKAGVLQAHKQALLVRSRSIDILEIVINKVDRGVLLFPLFLPLLQSLSAAYNSLTTQSLAEGTAYCNRLQTLVEQKLCKKKITLPAEDCTPEEVLEELEPLAALLLKLLNSPLVPLRHVAQACYLTVARAVWGSGSAPARAHLTTGLQSLFHTYATKKNSRISQRLIEDLLVTRLSDIAVPVLWADLVTQLGAVQHSFLRAELAHLFAAVVKKYHGLGSEAQAAVRAGMAGGLNAFAAQLSAGDTPQSADKEKQNKEGSSGKRLKALLGDVKEVAEFLKRSVPNVATGAAENGNKQGGNKVVTYEKVAPVRSAALRLSAVLGDVAARFAGAGAEQEEGAVESTGKQSKADKKSNALAGQFTAIRSALEGFSAATASAAAAEEAQQKSAAATTATPAGKGKKDKGAKTPKPSAAPAPVVVEVPAAAAATPSAAKKRSGEEATASAVKSGKKDKKAKL